MSFKRITILVPGIMGSKLADRDGNEVWPGTTWEFMFGYSDERFAQIMSPELIPSGVIRSYYISQYSAIIEPLKNNMGFVEMPDFQSLPEDPQNPAYAAKGLYVFSYDWRKDNRLAAEELAKKIDGLYEIAQENSVALEVTLLCHSMGGLVSRYYLESEKLKDFDGLNKVHKVIFMGTPHQGAPKAFFFISGERPMLWLKADQLQQLASHPDYVSVYQLLPTKNLPCVLRDPGIEVMHVHSNEDLQSSLGLDLTKIDNAKRFHEELDSSKLLNSNKIKTFCFYGAHHQTDTLANYNTATGEFKGIETSPAGDETVPVISAWLNGTASMAVEEAHSKIYGSSQLLKLLPQILNDAELEEEVIPKAITIALTHEFILKGENLQGVLSIDKEIAQKSASWKMDVSIQKKDDENIQIEQTITLSGIAALNIQFAFDISKLEQGIYCGKYCVNWQGEPNSEDYRTKGEIEFVILQ